ncbi:hypothetical protein CEXT_339441 [Caerostris extrusa]|uniref:Uncharacterized protein n=1 Tax=Caerostris extrusa TaxID=172846 RepID=A0AAV4TXP2_CAEEX|nr:hypothetical protein CEXT_339441 [Caerostris extrusa]
MDQADRFGKLGARPFQTLGKWFHHGQWSSKTSHEATKGPRIDESLSAYPSIRRPKPYRRHGTFSESKRRITMRKEE